MTDRDKVINGLEWCMNEKHDCYREKGCPYENEGGDIGCKYALHRDALALLKAQEPVEPTIGGDTDGPCKNWWYQCGSCKEALCYHDKYCKACGRAVKWE